MDNDAFGSAVQDHGYSNGLMLTVVSPDLAGDGDPACHSWLARRVDDEAFRRLTLIVVIATGLSAIAGALAG